MTEYLHAISMNCACCGAHLEVTRDMDRFTCAHCGNELIVERRGGTITLKQIADAVLKVQFGTDKTAAELALARLSKERDELQARFDGLEEYYAKEYQGRIDTANVIRFVCGFGAALSMLAFVGTGANAIYFIPAVICIIGFIKCSVNKTQLKDELTARCIAERAPIWDEILELDAQIAKKKAIADS